MRTFAAELGGYRPCRSVVIGVTAWFDRAGWSALEANAAIAEESLLAKFAGGFVSVRDWSCAMLPEGHDIYGSILADKRPASKDEPAVMCASFVRRQA